MRHDDEHQEKQSAGAEPSIDTYLESTVIWLSPRARTHRDEVRTALNRHWLVTQWDGSGKVRLREAQSLLQPRQVFRYYGPYFDSEVVDVFVWESWVLFICLASEVNDFDDPDARLDQISFTHDKEFGLWFSSGADVVAEFPELRPLWHQTSF